MSGALSGPAESAARLHLRVRTMQRVRAFFQVRGVLEITTPCIVGAAAGEPGIASMRSEGGWLRSSPEFEMKRLLAAGSGDVWQLGPVFRSGERGAHHRPEFTLIEWYRVGWDYLRLLDESVALLACLLRPDSPDADLGDCARMPYRDAFLEHFGVDPFGDERGVCAAAVARGLDGCRDAHDALDFLLPLLAAEHLPRDRLIALYDFPPQQASYARLAHGGYAQRFEIFYAGLELANGAQEWTEAADYRACFAAERALRARRGLPVTPPDAQFLAALERRSLPQCAGVAVGFERLLMCLAGARNIEEILLLPHG